MALVSPTLETSKRKRFLKTAIVILNWNSQQWLKKFLPSVIGNSPDYDIYVIDNASTQNDVKFIQTNFPEIKLIVNDENLGYAGGYNEGLKKIKADIFCLLNSDVEVTPNWIAPIEKLFEENENLAAVQPKILDFYQQDFFEYAGAGGGLVDNFGYPFCRGRVFWTLEKDHGQYDDTQAVFWASGACMFVRAKDFFEFGGFDGDFFAHMEEIDLCWRFHNAGKAVFYCGESTVYHVGGGTLNKNSPQKTFLNFRNSLCMLVKNLPKRMLLPVLLSRLILDGITALVFWRYEGFSHLSAIFRAHLSFYSLLFKMIKKRKINVHTYGSKCFVPFQYFILKRKKYHQLRD